MVRSTLPFIEKRLEDNGLKSAYPYPPNPVMPYATLTFDGDSYYNIETMMGHAKQMIRRCLDHAIYQPLQGLNMDYKVPCGKIVSTPNMSSTHDHVCKAGSLCPACREIVRLRGIIDDVADKQLTPEEKAKARLSAVVRDFTATMIPTQDPKYVIIGGKICNAESGVAIPDDEPIFILRAKDNAALTAVNLYAGMHMGGPYGEALAAQVDRFIHFVHNNPDRMKKPD